MKGEKHLSSTIVWMCPTRQIILHSLQCNSVHLHQRLRCAKNTYILTQFMALSKTKNKNKFI